MKKRVLVIDDEDLSEEISNLERSLKRKGIEVEFLQFNIGKPDVTEVLTNNQIDLEKVKSVFKARFESLRVHLVCFDYHLGPEEITGVDILHLLKSFLKRSKVLFYSSLLENIVTKILKRNVRDAFNPDEAKKLMMSLISARSEGFIDRKDFNEKVIQILSQEAETLDDIFAEKMEIDYPNFKTSYFDGLEISSLSHLLNVRDGKSLKFKHELIDQFIAYLIRISDDE